MACVCPWWLGYFLLGPVRRHWQDPTAILRPHVAPGMTVLEPGPGMGFFTLDLARLVGPDGRVIAVDVQPRMLEVLRRRLGRAGLRERVETRLATRGTSGLGDLTRRIDFVLAFAVVHELPDRVAFLDEVARALRPGGRMLLAEPRGHVTEEAFGVTLADAAAAGLRLVDRPRIAWSRAAVLART